MAEAVGDVADVEIPWEPDGWTYRGEGGSNIILAYRGTTDHLVCIDASCDASLCPKTCAVRECTAHRMPRHSMMLVDKGRNGLAAPQSGPRATLSSCLYNPVFSVRIVRVLETALCRGMGEPQGKVGTGSKISLEISKKNLYGSHTHTHTHALGCGPTSSANTAVRGSHQCTTPRARACPSWSPRTLAGRLHPALCGSI